jgi:hypothetical protein
VFGFSAEQHVVARCDLNGAMCSLDFPVVKRGTRGIVRSGPSLFSPYYTVEFANGRTVDVRPGDLRTTGGRGDASFQNYRLWRSGVHLGLFVVIGVPLIWTLIRDYAGGGSISGLIAAFPGQLMTTFAEVLSHAATVLGLPLLCLAVFLVLARRRTRQR